MEEIKRRYIISGGFFDSISLDEELSKLKVSKRSKDELIRAYAKHTDDKPVIAVEDTCLANIDWQDTKVNLINKCDEVFCGESDGIYRCLIKDYLIPMAESEEPRLISDISKEFNLSENKVYNMIKSRRMALFIENHSGLMF